MQVTCAPSTTSAMGSPAELDIGVNGSLLTWQQCFGLAQKAIDPTKLMLGLAIARLDCRACDPMSFRRFCNNGCST